MLDQLEGISEQPPPSTDSRMLGIQSGSKGFNLANIQGDVLPGFPKTLRYYYYFYISAQQKFWPIFNEFIVPKITPAADLIGPLPPREDFLYLNVAFTKWIFYEDKDLKDYAFGIDQYHDSKALGDDGTTDARGNWKPYWDKPFLYLIDGVFVISAFTEAIADDFVQQIDEKFSPWLTKIVVYKCRPSVSDHFGYRAGISNAQVEGVTFGTPAQPEIQYPGSPVVPMGVIVMGYDGDEDKDSRPDWAIDGSFMVTRVLDTLVPEFEAFLLKKGPVVFPDLPIQEAADRLGARLIGRWKDGTPMELSSDNPDPLISGNDEMVNNFLFDQSAKQKHCPFAAHIRKNNPRNDVSLDDSASTHHIRRQSRSYGPEVTDDERKAGITFVSRGTHFVCYASSVMRGYRHHQLQWCNNTLFPPKDITPGFDPIVGESNKAGVVRFMTGTNPDHQNRVMEFPSKFVLPRGGAYLYSPSISTLKSLGNDKMKAHQDDSEWFQGGEPALASSRRSQASSLDSKKSGNL